MSLVRLENLSVMSSLEAVTDTKVFLISKSSVAGLKSVEGQLDEVCNSQSGPCHHKVSVDSVVGSVPREIKSAGFDADGTCLHVAAAVASWMSATRLPTKVFQRVDVPRIQVSTIKESVHR
jgi:hypothetical protein